VDEEGGSDDAGDLDPDLYAELPRIAETAIEDESFRQSALLLVQGSGVLDGLEDAAADEEPPPDSGGSGLPTRTPPAEGYTFPALNVLTGESEEEDDDFSEFLGPPDLGPYDTGWMFLHPEDASPDHKDRPEKRPTKLDEMGLAILRDSSWTTLQLDTSKGYRIAYTLQRAVQ
jgi:hypothetical protein